ncbi:MAG: MBOAT family protein [Planctomycetota bacterium]|nr:MBOAT family protein [Planctomycetota bacterium]
MLFHTWTFALFFAIVYPVYRLAKGTRFEFWWLWAASYFFYGCWNPLYLLIIIYGTLADYFIVVGMEKVGHKKWWLAGSVVSNIGLLAFFKYAHFIRNNLNALLAYVGIPYALPSPDGAAPYTWFLTDGLNGLLGLVEIPYQFPHAESFLLPVGISFFTFQSMSYIIDCYRGDVERERSLLRYAVYVSLFTQLVAGPIERASNLLRQLRHDRAITREDIADGLSLFGVGLFKKVALADFLALYVDKVYAAPRDFQAPALALATFAFAWQIYFDFSGYTDMARGIARMLGLRLMLNFNNPYLADGLGDFWRRWHISLSTWFRDYVYIPLGGNRKGEFATYRNMFLTMVISGVWHGAAWTFLIWGALHGAGRLLTRALEQTPFYRDRVPRIVKQGGVFTFVCFAWIFFRAASVGDAWLIVTRIVTGARTGTLTAVAQIVTSGRADAWLVTKRVFASLCAESAFPALALGFVLAVWLYQFFYESRARVIVEWAPVRLGLVVLMAVYVAMFAAANAQPFIYFQF